MTSDKGITIKSGETQVKSGSGLFDKPLANPFAKPDAKVVFKPTSNVENPFAANASLFSNPFGKDKKDGQ